LLPKVVPANDVGLMKELKGKADGSVVKEVF